MRNKIVDTYFDNIDEQIIRQLKNAKTEILVAVAWITHEDIIKTLETISDYVNISIIVRRKGNKNVEICRKLKEIADMHHGHLYIAKGNDLHDKFCVIDGKKVITGSYNWQRNRTVNSWNNIVVIHDKQVAENYRKRFLSVYCPICAMIYGQKQIDILETNMSAEQWFANIKTKEGVPKILRLQLKSVDRNAEYLIASYDDGHGKKKHAIIWDNVYLQAIKGIAGNRKIIFGDNIPPYLSDFQHIFGNNCFEPITYQHSAHPRIALLRNWPSITDSIRKKREKDLEAFIDSIA